jgi:hypothetical protein
MKAQIKQWWKNWLISRCQEELDRLACEHISDKTLRAEEQWKQFEEKLCALRWQYFEAKKVLEGKGPVAVQPPNLDPSTLTCEDIKRVFFGGLYSIPTVVAYRLRSQLEQRFWFDKWPDCGDTGFPVRRPYSVYVYIEASDRTFIVLIHNKTVVDVVEDRASWSDRFKREEIEWSKDPDGMLSPR